MAAGAGKRAFMYLMDYDAKNLRFRSAIMDKIGYREWKYTYLK